jgi:hypothetical protein
MVRENFFDGQGSDSERATCISLVPTSHSGSLQR